MQLTEKQVLALKRKKGERNLTIEHLAKEIGVSRFTIGRIIANSHQNLTSTTVTKINNWLIDEYTSIR